MRRSLPALALALTGLAACASPAPAPEPVPEESAAVVAFLEQKPDRKRALADVLWAMTMSAEFRFNH